MLRQEKELQNLIVAVQKISTLNGKIAKIIEYLTLKIKSAHHEDCLIIEKIMGYSVSEESDGLPSLSSKQIAEIIVTCLKEVQSISIFLTLYSAWEKSRRTAVISIDWKFKYEKKRDGGALVDFNAWIQSSSHTDIVICNQVLSRVLAGLPTFLQSQKVKSTYLQFQSCLIWLSTFTIHTRDDHLCALRATRLIKETTNISMKDYQKKQHLILRKVIELLGYQQRRNNSLYLFFDKFTIRSQDIEYFINIREDFFEDLDEKHLCNVFFALVQPGLNKEILQFLMKVSGLLKSNEHFFTLRTLFQQVVLPVVAAKYKTHKTLGDDIFEFVLFYLAGFLAHCLIGEQGLKCIMQNIENIENAILKKKWAQLAILSCKDDAGLRVSIEKRLQKVGMTNITTKTLMAHIQKKSMVWVVTMHNGRKLKKYPEIQSHKFKGIQNQNNQCYIISIVQALFTTDQFRKVILKLLPQAKDKKLKLLKQLKDLFEGDLNYQAKDVTATVKYLKSMGPDEFRTTLRQEDAQEYLGKLFEYLEYELKKTKSGLTLFNEIFLTEYSIKIHCKECKVERELKDHEFHYINTYGPKQHFSLKKEEPLDENYKCQKCSQKKSSVKITTMINKPQILILHINRFRTTQEAVIKILGNHPIKRKINDYVLVGFVAHKGSSIHAGHYIYYSRIDQNRWALFNDNKVTEFNISKDEEFERQFRAENTPYILFYKLNKLIK